MSDDEGARRRERLRIDDRRAPSLALLRAVTDDVRMADDANPYAPPADADAELDDEGSEWRRAKRNPFEDERRSVLVCVALAFVSCGLYTPIWLIRRQRFLDALRADKKLGMLPTVALLSYIATFGLAFIGGAAQAHEILAVERIVSVAGGILTLVTNFRVAAILRSEFARTGRFLSVSGVGTFFLGIFYLQYKINQGADVAPRLKRKKKRAVDAEPVASW